MRIGVVTDSHGFVPALEAALAACRAAAVDLVVHCGDVLSVPFSPDPPGESIALLRAEAIPTIHGNHDLFLASCGTPDQERAFRLRAESRDNRPVGPWAELLPAGQARLTSDELAWLRALPPTLTLADVLVVHGTPTNPFAALDPAAAPPSPLVLCGHDHAPLLAPTPSGGLLVRPGAACGWDRQRLAGYAIVTRRPGGWHAELATAPYTPRDPDWSWARSLAANVHDGVV